MNITDFTYFGRYGAKRINMSITHYLNTQNGFFSHVLLCFYLQLFFIALLYDVLLASNWFKKILWLFVKGKKSILPLKILQNGTKDLNEGKPLM